jgi:phytoene dehydrogenase-like protein
VADHDAIVVGSGINSLACAALLARGGWKVCVLERSDTLGGAIQTAELTEPGYQHDVFSAWHPLWVGGAAHAELGDELAVRGLEYLNTEHPTATLYPDGEAAFLLRNADANAAELDRHAAGDGDAWRGMLASFFPNADLSFGVLGTELWSRDGLGLGLKALRRFGRPVLYTRGTLSAERYAGSSKRLAGLFPNFREVEFEGVHHLRTSHVAEPSRVAWLLLDLWR